MIELLEQLLEQDFEDLFQPVSDEEVQIRIAPWVKQLKYLIGNLAATSDRKHKLYWVWSVIHSVDKTFRPDLEGKRSYSWYMSPEAYDELAQDILKWLNFKPDPRVIKILTHNYWSGFRNEDWHEAWYD
jgi:hypothetical protein